VAARKAVVRFTANFEANLAQIDAYWAEHEAPQAYASLLDELGDTVIGSLERHPQIGCKFFARTAQSLEARERVAVLQKRLGAVEVREYLHGDYLLLYCLNNESGTSAPRWGVHLLAIKHHEQLSFDFHGFWQANRGEAG
jgi:ParE toxin of type II toxin-antitoxin system, parDE